MIAAFHLDNWLFILLIAVAMLFRWLASVASKASKGSDETDETPTSTPPTASPARTVPRPPVESDEERIRKFLEALGQPAGSQPPPPVAHRPTYQKPVVLPNVGPFGSPLPPLTTRPPDLPKETTPFEPIAKPLRRRTTITPKVSEETFEVHEVAVSPAPSAAMKSLAKAKTAAAPSETNLATLLRSSSGLRNAIILREVFGPPRSLQSLELL
jgi:hypothetical protein